MAEPQDAAETGARIARQLFGDDRYDRTRGEDHAGPRRELLRLADEVVFGRAYADETLSLRDRSLCTLAVLAALGHENQLAAHIGGALNIGVSEAEVAALITQVAMYAGYPAALNAMAVAEKAFATRAERTGDL